MNLVVLSIGLIVCSVVSANPAPQIFGYQPQTPVGQWVSQGLTNSFQTVANAIQGISRPTYAQVGVQPVQPPVSVQTVSVPVPIQPVPVQPYPIPNGPGSVPIGYPNGPGPIPNGPGSAPFGYPGNYPNGYPGYPNGYEPAQIIAVTPNGPNGPWPYRQAQTQDDEHNAQHWIPLPLISRFGDPTIIIISRPSKPMVPSEPMPSHENATDPNPNAIHPANVSEPNASQPNTNDQPHIQLFAPTPEVPLAELTTVGSTTTPSSENATGVADLGLVMLNRVPVTPTATANETYRTPK